MHINFILDNFTIVINFQNLIAQLYQVIFRESDLFKTKSNCIKLYYLNIAQNSEQ